MKPFFTIAFVLISAYNYAGNKDNRIHGELTPLRTCFDVKHYTIRLMVNPATQSISGSNGIAFKVVNPFKAMQLDFAETMQIDSIVYKNKTVSYTRKGNAALVNLPETLVKDASEKITVFFSGKPHIAEMPPWKGGFVWSKDNDNNDWVGLACEGIGASVWLPCKDHWSDEADGVDMYLTVPDGLTGVSNGKLISHSNVKDGFRTFHWQVRSTINNYNISINIGKYAQINDMYNGINALPITYYVLAYNKEKAENHFKQTKGMLEAFENYFGAYPFHEDSYKLVETPYWGMEHQSCVAYGNNYKNNSFDFDFIIIHESGHEWFANSITASDPADMWIHESFTTYSEALYVEFTFGKQKAIEYLLSQKARIKAKQPLQGPRNEYYHGFKDNDIYYKGSWMLHTMRNVLNNDSLWFSTIKNLCLQFRHKIVSTEDILAYFNSATGRNWDIFFKQYIYNGPLPVLEYLMEPCADGRINVIYKWANAVKGFDMPVKVYTNKEKSKFIWVHPSEKDKINSLDPNSVFIPMDDLFLLKAKMK